MLWIAALGASACAPAHGWERATRRTCEPEGPARVCLRADPDQPLAMTVGGARVIPGECVEAPRGGGSVRLTIDDGRAHRQTSRRIRARRGQVQAVTVDPRGKIQVVERTRCDRTPIE